MIRTSCEGPLWRSAGADQADLRELEELRLQSRREFFALRAAKGGKTRQEIESYFWKVYIVEMLLMTQLGGCFFYYVVASYICNMFSVDCPCDGNHQLKETFIVNLDVTFSHLRFRPQI